MSTPTATTTADFPELFEKCIPHLRAYARSLVHNADAADDLVQDALLRAWAARSQFAAGTNFMAWMFTILRNRFLDQRRRDRGGDTPIENVVHINLTTAPQQDTIIYFDDMARAFWRLSPHHREILMLVGAMGFGYDEAAKVIGCAVGTVRSRLSRARTELQGSLDQEQRGEGRRRKTDRGATEFMKALAAA
jgi:RNA polymerase sigma-70 factor (ECF subfamily)